MEPSADVGALRQFFTMLPDEAFAGTRSIAGRTVGETFGNPDVLSESNRQKFFPSVEDLDAYISDSGLDSGTGVEYIYIIFHADGSCTLYIAD